MRRMFTLAAAALTLAGFAAASSPAEAQRYYRRDRDNHGDAVAAGVLGFALGAAVGSSGNRYNNGYYNGGYYAPRPAYGYGYGSGYGYGGGYGGGYYAPRSYYGGGYGYRGGSRCTVERRYDGWGRSTSYRRCW